MDLLTIVVYVLAGLGGASLLFVLWMVNEEKGKPDDHIGMTYNQIKAFDYLDNEVRGTISTDYYVPRGSGYIQGPTLKGRVDEIEKYLGIKVEVKQAQPAKLVTKKGK